MIRVYLTNYYNTLLMKSSDFPDYVDLSTQYTFYGIPAQTMYKSVIEITDIVTSVDIENIDFYIRKEPSKARLELLMNESIYGYSFIRTNESLIENYDSTTKKLLSAIEKNEQLGFNNNTFRLGSIITILDDTKDVKGNEQKTSETETFSGTVQSGTRNADGSFSFTSEEQVSNRTETVEMPDDAIFDNSMKLFVGRITEMNNDHEKIGITVENCIYEFRNVYRELYSTLKQYKNFDPTKKGAKLRATAGDIINVCRSMVTGLRPIASHTNKLDTKLIYDIKYDFYVPLSAILNKSLMEIMQWALQQYWSNFVVKNKLAIKRADTQYFDDIFEITADQETGFTEKLVYSYPVVRFNYNVTLTKGTPVPIESMYVSTFYEINTQDIKSDAKIGLYNVTILNPDNIVSYKFNRSTKNIVNDLFLIGTIQDDKKNVTVKKTLQFPPQEIDPTKLTDSDIDTAGILWNSQIKYGKHRLLRQIDLIDNVVSLETFAKDIGSLLAEPDYGFTVNIINYNGIQLNDAVLVNLTNTNKKVYEVKNIVYKYVGGRSEATLDLKPVLIAINNNQKSKPSTIHNTGR